MHAPVSMVITTPGTQYVTPVIKVVSHALVLARMPAFLATLPSTASLLEAAVYAINFSLKMGQQPAHPAITAALHAQTTPI